VEAELKIKRLRGLVSAVGVALMSAAVVHELRKPAAERTWHGRLWGRVPYEFRLPTLERLRQAYWAPEDSHVFTDTPFGVGWSLNLGRLAHACSNPCTKMRDGKSAASTAAAA